MLEVKQDSAQDDPMKRLGLTFREARVRSNMSIREVAERAGSSKSYIAAFETGRMRISEIRAINYAIVVGVGIDMVHACFRTIRGQAPVQPSLKPSFRSRNALQFIEIVDNLSKPEDPIELKSYVYQLIGKYIGQGGMLGMGFIIENASLIEKNPFRNAMIDGFVQTAARVSLGLPSLEASPLEHQGLLELQQQSLRDMLEHTLKSRGKIWN